MGLGSHRKGLIRIARTDAKSNPVTPLVINETIKENMSIPVELMTPYEKIADFVGKGGLVPFEHGFKKPVITYKKEKYVVTMVEDTKLHCYLKQAKGTLKVPYIIPLRAIASNTAEKLYSELNNYLNYCKYEA